MIRLLPVLVSLLLVVSWSPSAAAKPPPFELAQKSVAQARANQKTVELHLVVTRTHGGLSEWKLEGTFDYGKPTSLAEDVELALSSPTALRLLWIGLLSVDPIASISKLHGFVNSRKATVGVHEGFVYVYGSSPRIAVYRDLKRLAWFEIRDDGVTWRVGFTWDDGDLVGALITRDGRTVLTARSERPRVGARKRVGDD